MCICRDVYVWTSVCKCVWMCGCFRTEMHVRVFANLGCVVQICEWFMCGWVCADIQMFVCTCERLCANVCGCSREKVHMCVFAHVGCVLVPICE